MHLKTWHFHPVLIQRQTLTYKSTIHAQRKPGSLFSCFLATLTWPTCLMSLLTFNLFPSLSICLFLCFLPLITSLSLFWFTDRMSYPLKRHGLLLYGLMSYSSSQQAGLIKAERDNSLSRSLELTTLVIPWEISYVLCITFVSLPLSHAHTHFQHFLFCLCFISVHLWAWLTYILTFVLSLILQNVCLTLFLSSLSSLFFLTLTCFLPLFYVRSFSLLTFFLLTQFSSGSFEPPPCLVIIYSSLPQIFGLASTPLSFPCSHPLFTHIKLYIPPEPHTGNLPVGPVSPTVAQLAGLIDQWSSWIPQKVNYQLAHQSYFGRKGGWGTVAIIN